MWGDKHLEPISAGVKFYYSGPDKFHVEVLCGKASRGYEETVHGYYHSPFHLERTIIQRLQLYSVEWAWKDGVRYELPTSWLNAVGEVEISATLRKHLYLTHTKGHRYLVRKYICCISRLQLCSRHRRYFWIRIDSEISVQPGTDKRR